MFVCHSTHSTFTTYAHLHLLCSFGMRSWCVAAGELASYVTEELNVAELKTAHPDEFGTMKVILPQLVGLLRSCPQNLALTCACEVAVLGL